ncbi:MULTISPECIES: hypothetical protein [Sinobaca]|uniref:Uncharacterized protein n=1 Tax=Sinobaca qinghaiensis TaxID=342944 RepID=A0A419V857_9BACL|nr:MULTISPECIES: hypothetical protein [Sinobaca]RKD76271.1 hypothetical protein ATL39_0486 [Sinobaca qinghaiensis]
MALKDKFDQLKGKAMEKGKLHWEENKDQYKEKGRHLKDTIQKKMSK